MLDFDGVVLESVDVKTRAFARLFAAFPTHLDQIIGLHLDLAGTSRFEKFRLIYRDIIAAPLDGEEEARLGREFSALVLDEILACPFVPGAERFLEERSRSHLLFIASATPEEELLEIVHRRGLDRYFAGVHGTPRTKSDILREILASRGLARAEVLFVGDAVSDFEHARSVGVPFVGRLRPGHPNPFPDSGRIRLVADLAELDRTLVPESDRRDA